MNMRPADSISSINRGKKHMKKIVQEIVCDTICMGLNVRRYSVISICEKGASRFIMTALVLVLMLCLVLCTKPLDCQFWAA